MPDPIEDLEGFTMPTVTPMPASDVRRRGDKIRRRNNALAAVGGVAAVAVLAVPFAIFAGNQNQAETPQPAPSPEVAWVQEIPEDFPLTDQMPDGTESAGSADGLFTACGSTVWSTGRPLPVDSAQASWEEENSSGAWDRRLVVYPDENTAQAAFMTFHDGEVNCPTDEGGRIVNEVARTDLGTDEAFTLTNQVKDGALLYDLTAVQVARSGNALYIESSHTSAGGDQVAAAELQRLAERSTDVLAAMCVFSAEGCGGGDDTAVDTTIGEGAVPAIPQDFPLDQGLPAGGLDGTVPSPDPTISCDHPAEKPKSVERARAQWHTVSAIEDRQLLTFSRQADAEAYVEAVSTTDCNPDRVTTVSNDLATGAMVSVGHNENAGTVDPGLVVTYVVRVGRAVLLTQRIDEGYTWTDVQQETSTIADDTFTQMAPLVAAMCTFSETGC